MALARSEYESFNYRITELPNHPITELTQSPSYPIYLRSPSPLPFSLTFAFSRIMTLHRIASLLLALVLTVGLTACGDSTDPVGPGESTDLTVTTAEDVPADPVTRVVGGRPMGSGQFTFYNLRDGEVVLSSSATDRADSNSTAWDLALQGTTIRVNGGTSGPGDGAAYVAEAAFEEITSADAARFQTDASGGLAIPGGSGNGWYTYNANGENYVRPIPGRTLVIRTADGSGTAKIRILSYYRGNPDLPADRDAHPSRYYTFDYVYQPDGSSF